MVTRATAGWCYCLIARRAPLWAPMCMFSSCLSVFFGYFGLLPLSKNTWATFAACVCWDRLPHWVQSGSALDGSISLKHTSIFLLMTTQCHLCLLLHMFLNCCSLSSFCTTLRYAKFWNLKKKKHCLTMSTESRCLHVSMDTSEESKQINGKGW